MANTQTADRVAITDERGNTIWLRNKRMGFGIRNKVLSAATHMTAGSTDADMDVGAYNTALLLHNIVAWEGPDLNGKAISAESLDDLDPDLGDKALEQVARINAPRSADPNDSTSSTEAG